MKQKTQKNNQNKIIARSKLQDSCLAFAFNNNSQILLAANGFKILVFSFFNCKGYLKLINKLKGPFHQVSCLQFMKSSKQFISTGNNGAIIQWQKKDCFIATKALIGHKQDVNCFVITQNEELMMSGSDDNTIKIWDLLNSWKCIQTIYNRFHGIICLCLNQSNTKLLSLDKNSIISVLQSINSWWAVIQIIPLDGINYRSELMFISENVFVLSENREGKLIYYQYNQKKNKYRKIWGWQKNSQISNINNYIISQANTKLIIRKFSKMQKSKFISKFHFQTSLIYWKMTKNEKYVITWDGDDFEEDHQATHQIQVRLFHE